VKVVVWLTEGTWPACVDAARDLPGAEITLLHVIDLDSVEVAAGARAGLFGRATRQVTGLDDVLVAAQAELFDAAEARLGRTARRAGRRGRAEREALAACAEAGLLVLARDGDHTRLGPRSLGHAARFVLDHAPCRVLLVWPDDPPDPATAPPPPGPPPGPPHAPPPGPPPHVPPPGPPHAPPHAPPPHARPLGPPHARPPLPGPPP
jgi:nucleotide-binding universal stress UspA family protein